MKIYFEEGLSSFHAFNIGSVGQRAAKLLAVLEKVCNPACVDACSPGSTLTGSEWFSKFDSNFVAL